MPRPILERLQSSRPLLLDGATGTELSRRGVDLDTPSWTAGAILEAPRVLWQIHRDYVEAGADIVTANTFRTHARNLAAIGQAARTRELTFRAVEIARDAAGKTAYVAGSMAPLEDCYSPQNTPESDSLLAEHLCMAENLAAAKVDFILVETQLTIREGTIAARAASATGLPFGVSFVCNAAGQLLSGESLLNAYLAIAPLQPALFLVNCVPVEEVLTDLAPLRAQTVQIPLGAYANTGRLLANGSWEATKGELPAVYAEFVEQWKQADMKAFGGCCGTTPEHISYIYKRLYESNKEL